MGQLLGHALRAMLGADENQKASGFRTQEVSSSHLAIRGDFKCLQLTFSAGLRTEPISTHPGS